MKSYREIFVDKPLRIVTRQSKLAMVQTDIVTAQMADVAHEIIGVTTSGDEVLDRPLVEIGGKGVFIKALEAMMVQGAADAAVHSFKDMETVLADGTSLCVVLPRADRRDALVGPYKSLDEVPQGAIIGTSSVRRASFLRHLRPDLEIKLLRGNVQRRLSRLDAGDYDAIILAMAGLERLGLADKGHAIAEDVMMPSASQGVIAIQIATQDTARAQAMADVFAPMHCKTTSLATRAERAMLAHLDGSCRTPIGAIADVDASGRLSLSGCVLSSDGRDKFDAHATGDIVESDVLGPEALGPEALGIAVAKDLLAQCGGRDFLA